MGLRALFRAFTREKPLELALVGYGAMLLRRVFVSTDLSCIIDYIPSGIPVYVIVVVLPLLFSLVSGVPTGGVALSIPIIQQLTVITPALASLIYISIHWIPRITTTPMPYLYSPIPRNKYYQGIQVHDTIMSNNNSHYIHCVNTLYIVSNENCCIIVLVHHQLYK